MPAHQVKVSSDNNFATGTLQLRHVELLCRTDSTVVSVCSTAFPLRSFPFPACTRINSNGDEPPEVAALGPGSRFAHPGHEDVDSRLRGERPETLSSSPHIRR